MILALTNKLLLKFGYWQRKHWIISLLSVRLLAIWFSFVITYAGKKFLLIKVESGNTQFTKFGFVCTIILILIVIFGEIARKYVAEDEKKNSEFDNGAAFILRNLRDSTSVLCDSKYNTLLGEIAKVKKTGNEHIPHIISNPEKQLNSLASQLSSCLCKLLQEEKGAKWRLDDIFVSIAYEYPSDEPGVWHWATKERGLSLEKLFSEKDETISTMSYCLKNKGNRVFYNSKQKALKEKHYILDSEDEFDSEGKPLGSIACFEESIKKDDVVYIHYVLTISTYDKSFVPPRKMNNENQDEVIKEYNATVETVRYNIQKNIVPDFMERVKIELCLLYLEKLGQSRGTN